jgi:hypothetical protein
METAGRVADGRNIGDIGLAAEVLDGPLEGEREVLSSRGVRCRFAAAGEALGGVPAGEEVGGDDAVVGDDGGEATVRKEAADVGVDEVLGEGGASVAVNEAAWATSARSGHCNH